MRPRKVLVVDDSKLLHRMFEMMLRQYPLVHAYDGREGLDALAQNGDVDLILLDINMPRMNGLEFLGVVKKDAKLAKIPVVIVTTEGANQDAEKGLAAGAAAYVKKPFRNEELLGVIEKLA
jgi:two-component system chemotaxis response regulator CheY